MVLALVRDEVLRWVPRRARTSFLSVLWMRSQAGIQLHGLSSMLLLNQIGMK